MLDVPSTSLLCNCLTEAVAAVIETTYFTAPSLRRLSLSSSTRTSGEREAKKQPLIEAELRGGQVSRHCVHADTMSLRQECAVLCPLSTSSVVMSFGWLNEWDWRSKRLKWVSSNRCLGEHDQYFKSTKKRALPATRLHLDSQTVFTQSNWGKTVQMSQ